VPDPFITARALRDAISTGASSAEAACRDALERIATVDGALHAFHHVDADRALARVNWTGRRRPSDRCTACLWR
jgi:aspartyl-tRNA(Asn)/glutamyl-tRNA(Gln) amidotransferase subunit A